MNGIWIEVTVITKSEALEPISGIFYGLGCPNVAIEDPEDLLSREQGPLTWDFADINILEHKGNAAVVKAYFSEEDNIDEVVETVRQKLEEIKSLGLDIGEGKVTYRKMHEEDWANNWKQYYKPVKITDKIVIKPIWEEYEKKDDELIIELDPGMAFGTGTHETTRMCIKALDKYVKPNTTVFDVGCGSGILAIAAAKLGANHVVGVDLDPVAVDSSKENISFNNLNNIEVLEGNLLDVVSGKADIVVANIIAEIICVLTEDVKKALNEGGLFIVSGIIHDRVDMVKEKFAECGFEVMEINKDGEWNCIVAKSIG
ncbi:50S ribosomal protein L11 methyltransferase [Clostridium saccharobutylicum]|uniref:Ribosomal protein L11 methyltransferase n=1 Tax=Clostridium saccharobutylicum DSM 13864 TaxID=1345695 RepID=U5MQZ6_CLOSA|nr:50S ribosomal protein L11 methyltransferase [Clostridium saccharobutylicum]AGX42096.1 ribosomal protein L11 methyltransferase PrmA [Clostridium saccharobutylicum DSM 13864]AQR89373.1 ribosomal protein L11 methyltransferase [Clostridium saccharobutylicum]AQR99275.1 ribosomal protein L11 methyltransferase [Clostridium saccharobutylicum]AQS13261.1 ribosomal protein L11 methyltransferase [Clostridium saccharobutylicum]MBA2904551.1 ribosomal protein L11 methyltransferase [Clostridium saccharobut